MSRPAWRRIAVLALAAGLVFGGYRVLRDSGGGDASARYRTEEVSRGDITRTVSANGTLNPVTLINVGTQVSGTVSRLYADYNDRVKAGQILARLDPSLFKAQLLQDEGNLIKAKAGLRLAEANARRSRVLFSKGYVSRADLDQAIEALGVARADVQVARGQVERDRTNLRYTVIRSPVSGVVVARTVNVGQTVAASFQTPTLFQIAEDLKHMQIDTSMAEADVGGVRVGQAVRFSVDAFPDRVFQGVVRQIRLNPTIQENVVTYDAVVDVANPEQHLLPGMTAYVTIVTARRHDVLRVPDAALRFRPVDALPARGTRERGYATVYRLEHGAPVPVRVRVGISDTHHTEILSGPLKVGEPVIVEDLRPRHPARPGGRMRLRMF